MNRGAIFHLSIQSTSFSRPIFLSLPAMVDHQPSSPSLRVFEDDALDLPFHVYRMRERAMGFEPGWIQNLMIAGGSEPAGSGKGDKRLRNPPQRLAPRLSTSCEQW